MILVDTSYLVYYHGYAVWNWFEREIGTKGIKTDGTFDPISDPEYKAAFRKRFFSRINNAIQNDVVFFDRSELIFCLDCSKKDIWRNDVYPEYKLMRRTKKKERKFSWSGIFNYVVNILLPEYQEKFGCKVLQHPSAEGDDIIAILTKYLYDKGDKEIIIIASDGDITQLSDKATIITLKGEKKTYSSVVKKYPLAEGEWTVEKFLMHKAIMGDNGDEIPAIIPKCGPKTALKYLNDINKFIQLLEDNEIKKKFYRNTKIIDFSYIPKLIQKDVIEKYDEQITNELGNL